MKPFSRHALCLWFVACLCGCTLARVDVAVVSERTSLENQVLGTYNALDTEMLLLASVRGVDPRGQIRTPPRRSQDQKDAMAALQLQSFHTDDLAAFKRLGWVGENNAGLLTAFPMEKSGAPADLKEFAQNYPPAEFESVISQLNDAREVIMRRVIDLNENLTEESLPDIRRIFARLNAENAAAGERIQAADGTWSVKP